jgi:hypothetical protein
MTQSFFKGFLVSEMSIMTEVEVGEPFRRIEEPVLQTAMITKESAQAFNSTRYPGMA